MTTPLPADAPMSRAALQAEATRWLGAYMDSGRERTDHLRKAGQAIARLRGFFFLRDGATDWGGRSTAYRALIREVYSGAGVSAEEADSVQSALRYHVGNYLREAVPTDDLAISGLGQQSPKARRARDREVVAALAAAVSAVSVQGFAGDPARLVRMADVLLGAAADAGLGALTGAARSEAAAALASIEERVQVLSAAVEGDLLAS